LDHWRSHIPKNNPPKQFCEWSFEQGDRKWQQDEEEHEFELWSDFFGRKKEWIGAGISGWGPRGAHKVGGRALHPCGQLVRSPGVYTKPEILKYFIKNHTKFSGHLENFYFWDIFYCTDNSENRQKVLLLLYLI